MESITLVIFFLVFIISGSIHEFAHAYTAYRCGDDTARMQGRMTLNPIAHIDIFGTIIFPVILIVSNAGILFGWMKPVPVQPNSFRNPKRDDAIVSLAGPFANIFLVLLFTLIVQILAHLFTPSIDPNTFINFFIKVSTYFILINVILAGFNLLPVPPLDGGHILNYFLPDRYKDVYNTMQSYGFIILIGLMLFINYANIDIGYIIRSITFFLMGIDIFIILFLNMVCWFIMFKFIQKNKPDYY